MIGAPVLRIIAIAIAIAGVADPAITREAPVRQRLGIAVTDSHGMSSGQRLRALLEGEYDVTAYAAGAASTAAACPQHGGCVVVSDGRVPTRLTAGANVVGGVRVSAPDSDVAIIEVTVPAAAHLAAASSLHVRWRGNAARVEVFDGNVPVGAADIAAGGKDGDVTVPWVPIAAGARRLTIRVAGVEAHVGVTVGDAPASVLFYEPEATWLGTFVRRTLDGDPRFSVAGRTRLAPPVSVTRGGVGRLTSDALRDVAVVIVTAPESLVNAEVDLLERFVRVRGGSLLIVPDRRPGGAVTRLIADVVAERREDAPTAVGPLKATEIVSFNAAAPGVSVIESAGDSAVIVSRALGRGRVIVSGALDAWRHRDAAFTGFWSALVADAAHAAGSTLTLTVDPPVLSQGGEARVTAEWRTMDALPAELSAEAALTCGGQPTPVRLWPTARPGMFAGTVRPEARGDCELGATLEHAGVGNANPVQVRNTVRLAAGADEMRGAVNVEAFEAAIAAHGGLVVTSGDEAALASRVRERMPPLREPRQQRPMHSPWWILPFAACLGGEWWLRRRAGLR